MADQLPRHRQSPDDWPISGTATRHFAVGHPAADGHFPGNPIIPGAVLLREILAAVRATDEASGGATTGYDIRSAKFHQPVRPGDTLVITWTTAASGDVRFSGVLAGATQPAVTGALHSRQS